VRYTNRQKDYTKDYMTIDKRADFNYFIDTQLNPEQKQVVQEKNGVLLVCAGAGSGKTRVITARITNLMLNHGAPAWSIIALTFTNKAAREMQERVHSFLPHGMTVPFVGTFHSYCLRLLKINSHLISTPEFSILDSDDQEKLVKQILHKFGVHKKVAPKQILSVISQLKNGILTPDDLTYKPSGDLLTQQLVHAYEKEKAAARCFDFDDLLVETIKLFQNNPEFKEKYQNTVRHVLVDEYQDTNHTQHTLLKMLCMTLREAPVVAKAMARTQDDRREDFALDSLCVVGDEDQSIYSWRGATVTNIINFNGDFPQTKSITIQQNYRSVQPILDLANNVIQHNTLRNKKKLWSQRTASDRIRLLYCNSGYQEADAIAAAVKIITRSYGAASCAILYRSHYQSRVLEEACIRNSVPYKIIGGIQFYERQEVKDLLAYLKLLANPFDRISFMRTINTPHRGLGDAFQEQFLAEWDKQPFLNYAQIAQEFAVTGKKKESLQDFLHTLSCDVTQLPSTLLEQIIIKTRYFAYLKDTFDVEEAQTKIENVKELIVSIKALEAQGIATVADFLHEVALLQDALKKPQTEQQCITLMTLHAAKGLEFDTIILTGLEEGILPSSHSLYQHDKVEEERRLLYVGITRARERLIMTYTRYRTTFGQMTDQMPSRFIKELGIAPQAFADCTQWATAHFTQYLQQWLAQHQKSVAITFTDDPFAEEKQEKSTKTIIPAHKALWHKNQTVHHTQFGTGIIDKIEVKSDETTYLTVKFKAGSKKIDSKFVSV